MKFKGVKFLIVVIFAYVVLLTFDTSSALLSLQKSGEILKKIAPIFPLIILISALINYFLKPKDIVKHVGEDSGVKGVFYALLGGVLSHGPMYAWYGILEDMKSHGLKDGLIATFLYARSIKLPLLPFMVDMFGILFTIIIIIYTLIFSILQGMAIERLK